MKKKKFDCVEMAHRARSAIAKKIAGMTIEEQVAFWHAESRKTSGKTKTLRPKRKTVHVHA